VPLSNEGGGVWSVTLTAQQVLFGYGLDSANHNFVGFLEASVARHLSLLPLPLRALNCGAWPQPSDSAQPLAGFRLRYSCFGFLSGDFQSLRNDRSQIGCESAGLGIQQRLAAALYDGVGDLRAGFIGKQVLDKPQHVLQYLWLVLCSVERTSRVFAIQKSAQLPLQLDTVSLS